MDNDSEEEKNIIPDGYVVDYIDGKFRKDTPEEYIRQNIEKKLVLTHKYPKDKIKVEHTISSGSKKPRVDLAIFLKDNSFTQENISIIIECKKETISAKDKKDGVGQMQSYMASCPNAEWGMWTNGKEKYVSKKEITPKGKITFVDYNDIPSADGDIDDIDKPKRENLKDGVEDKLLFVFKTCHNHIYVNDGVEKSDAFFQLLKVIFCKIEDERNFPNPLEFYSTSNERNNADGQLTVQKRIHKIFEKVIKKYEKIFPKGDKINLKPRSLAWTVSELQSYNLLSTNIDIKGKAYEEIVGSNLRGDKGQFFTPRNITKMCIDIMQPKEDEKILDPACGTGGFLVSAMNYVVQELENKFTKSEKKEFKKWDDKIKNIFRDKISQIASENFFGFDIAPELVKATKMNMVMNNDGSGNILQNDSLKHPHEWELDFKRIFSEKIKTSLPLSNNLNLSLFDIIITNPPFGAKIPVKDPDVLEQYELGHIWENKKGKWQKSSRLQTSVPPEQLFVERCYHFLKPEGKMAIVLPDGILSSPGLEYLRYWIILNFNIIATLDLHADTFQPKNGTQTSVLILQKKPKPTTLQTNTIFAALLDKIGHDKRGTPIFKKDEYGDEILEEYIDEEKNKTKRKIVDDDSIDIPKNFKDWLIKEQIKW